MNSPFTSGLLVRSVLVASLSSLVGCSSVLRAYQLSRSFPQQPAETVADVSPESRHEPASIMDETQRLYAEATYGLPRSMASGYRWVFILKEGTRSTPGLGNWVVKSNQ